MSISITAEKREALGRDNWQNRAAGQVPAVVYGPKTEPKNITVNTKTLIKVFKEVGESSLVDLIINGEQPLKVLVQDLQFDPLSGEVIHVDFRAVDLTKEITAEIKLEFIGEAPAVKELGGTLIHALDEIEVKGLPQALVASLTIDISKLKTFNDVIRISDLALPEGITAIDDLEEAIATVAPPRSEEEMAELSKAVEIDVGAVEVEKKEKEKDEATDEKADEEKKK